MTGTDLVAVDVDRRIAALARRHRGANTLGIQVVNLIGMRAESLLARLPAPARARLDDVTMRALRASVAAAQVSRGVVPDQRGWLHTALATGLGAVGGIGGLPSALAELPVTVTVLFRAIQAAAAENGFDPADPEVQALCLSVFATAGPLAQDDGADMGFLAARVTLTGGAVHKVVAAVAPRLATALGQKLAAQTVPVLGAAAGAATNYVYTSYYQDMAHVVFGLRRLERESGRDWPSLVAALDEAVRAG